MNIWDLAVQPFVEFMFMRRALIGTTALALGYAPLGVFLLLRRMSLMGDAISHAILPGVALGFLLCGMSLPALSLGGLLAGLAVALAAGAMARLTILREDASLAVFYLISLSLGVLLVSLKGSNVDLLHLLFGSILALDNNSLLLLASVTTITLPVLAIIYRPLVIECFDPVFLRTIRGGGSAIHLIFLSLVVLNLVSGFQALGTLMAMGLMMLPAATARLWARSLDGMIATAIPVAVMAVYIGLLLSYHMDLPSGPAIILTSGGILMLSLLIAPYQGLFKRLLTHTHLAG